MAETIKEGDFITIDYVGKVKDTGKIFDLTREDIAKEQGMMSDNAKYGPVTIVVGAKHVIPGLDKKLVGLNVGDTKSFTISPSDGFGNRDSTLVKLLPKSEFTKQKINPIPGLPVNVGNGQYGLVQSVSGGRVKVDFNHPLAGKELVYEVEIGGRISKPEDKIKSLFRFHLSKVDTSTVDIVITGKTVEVTAKDPHTRRYINLTEEIVAGDILRYIEGVETVKFIGVFEKQKAAAKTAASASG